MEAGKRNVSYCPSHHSESCKDEVDQEHDLEPLPADLRQLHVDVHRLGHLVACCPAIKVSVQRFLCRGSAGRRVVVKCPLIETAVRPYLFFPLYHTPPHRTICIVHTRDTQRMWSFTKARINKRNSVAT